MTDPDYLSDAEAEAMARAFDPQFWTEERVYPDGFWRQTWCAARDWRLAAIRRAWSARPATARAQGVASLTYQGGLLGVGHVLDAALDRRRHLTENANGRA